MKYKSLLLKVRQHLTPLKFHQTTKLSLCLIPQSSLSIIQHLISKKDVMEKSFTKRNVNLLLLLLLHLIISLQFNYRKMDSFHKKLCALLEEIIHRIGKFINRLLFLFSCGIMKFSSFYFLNVGHFLDSNIDSY